jgi:Uma2 family endonuclease
MLGSCSRPYRSRLNGFGHCAGPNTIRWCEVAEASLQKDKKLKARIYAVGGVPEYWLVNLIDKVVLVHRRPLKGRYAQVRTLRKSGVLSPASFPDVKIPVAGLIH